MPVFFPQYCAALIHFILHKDSLVQHPLPIGKTPDKHLQHLIYHLFKNLVGLDSIGYFISELHKKISTPSIIIFPSGYLSTINKDRRTITPPHTCAYM